MTKNDVLYFVHFLDGTRFHRDSIVWLTNDPSPATKEIIVCGSPLRGPLGNNESYDIGWILGPVTSENEANRLLIALAECYHCDVMVNDEMLGLQYLGAPGRWISHKEAAAILGRIGGSKTSQAKKLSSATNGRKGGRPRKS